MAFTGLLGTIDSMLGNIVLGEIGGGGGGGSIITESVTDTLSLTQTIAATQFAHATDTLSLSQLATFRRDVNVHVTDTLSMSQSATDVDEHRPSVTDTLSLSQSATYEHDIHASASSTIALTQTVRPSIFNISVTDTMTLTQSVSKLGPVYVNVNQRLFLSDSPHADSAVSNQAVFDDLRLTDRANRVIHISVSDSLSLVSAGERPTKGHDVLALVQSAHAAKGGSVTHTLGITDTVTLKGLWTRHVTDTLALGHAATYILGSPCLEKVYSPFIGADGSAAFTAPPTSAPTLGDGTLTVTYPYSSPTSTVVLRNPEFQNKDSLSFNRINRTTFGGTLIVYSDPKWPKIQDLTLQVNGLKYSQAQAIKTFLAASLGKEIGLLDHENRQWRGFITNPDSAVSQPGRSEWSVYIAFEGRLA